MGCLTCKLPASHNLEREDFCIQELPGGAIDCNNLSFTTAFEFYPGSLEVYLDGNHMIELEVVPGIDNKSFTLVISPDDPRLIGSAPRKSEFIRINYIKADSSSLNACIVYL